MKLSFHAPNGLALARRLLGSDSPRSLVESGRFGLRPGFVTAALWTGHGRVNAGPHGALLDLGYGNARSQKAHEDLRYGWVRVHFGKSFRFQYWPCRRQKYCPRRQKCDCSAFSASCMIRMRGGLLRCR